MSRQVMVIPAEEGGYYVEVPGLPGRFSQGGTLDEALENVKEAIQRHIKAMLDCGEDVPEDLAPIWIVPTWN